MRYGNAEVPCRLMSIKGLDELHTTLVTHRTCSTGLDLDVITVGLLGILVGGRRVSHKRIFVLPQ